MRVLLADDHMLVRETIAMFLQSEGVDDVVLLNNLDEAISAVRSSDPFDLVLLDYNMPGMDGLTGLTRMMQINNGRPVALLSGEATAKTAREAIDAGAAGFVPKSLGAKSMISAIRFMASGEVFFPFNIMQKSEQKAADGLTERETEVLRGLCEGKSNKEIARDLDLQEVTIKLHVKTLCRKLDARNRTHAAMIGKERSLV